MISQEADKINKFLGEMIAFHGRGEISNFITSLVDEDEPYNSDPHEWSEGEHRYFLTTHALRWLPEPTRFVNETDNEIAKRVIEEYIENGLKEKYRKGAGHGWEKGISYKHEVSLLQDCYDWLDQ